jgi:hypothetical protein
VFLQSQDARWPAPPSPSTSRTLPRWPRPGLLSRACSCKGAKAEIADKVVNEIRSRLRFLNDVGLNYLSLDRSADTL